MADSEAITATKRTMAWNQGTEEAIRDAFTEDVRFEPSGQIPGYAKPVVGIEGYLQFFRDWMSSFTDYRVEVRRMADIGDGRVVLDSHQEGTSKSGASVVRDIFMLAVMRDGRCASYAAFEGETAMLAHAGLDSWPPERD